MGKGFKRKHLRINYNLKAKMGQQVWQTWYDKHFGKSNQQNTKRIELNINVYYKHQSEDRNADDINIINCNNTSVSKSDIKICSN